MGRFWIDYSTSVLIEAETAEKAEELFWDGNYDALGCAEISIDGIEEAEDD
jgi:hypothetical protein